MNVSRDTARAAFLNKLHAHYATDSLTPFEADFLASFLLPRFFVWTPKRRDVADAMMKRYLHLLPISSREGREGGEGKDFVPSSRSSRDQIPAPTPGECCYLVMDESRRQVRCGQPAEFQTPSGALEYCRTHAEKVTRDMRRKRPKFRLVELSREGRKGDEGKDLVPSSRSSRDQIPEAKPC